MIKYILKCKNKHEFESWFSNSNEYEKLKKKNLIECIFCKSQQIEKDLLNFDELRIKKIIKKHVQFTNSSKGKFILDNWKKVYVIQSIKTRMLFGKIVFWKLYEKHRNI